MADRQRANPADSPPGNPYEQWITDNWTDVLGTCSEETVRMAGAFPELRRVRGHYVCPIWGAREHWWVVAPDGTVVDPTRDQFPSGGLGDYVPWKEGREEPIGKCMNCGGYVFASRALGDHACSPKCSRALEAYYG